MEIEIIEKLIKKYSAAHGDFVRRATIAEKYYRNENVCIMTQKPQKDEEGNPMRSADNRIPRNFHGLLVDQKTAYAFTAPPLFDTGDKAVNEKITEALGDEYQLNCMELCVNAANMSVAWVHYWENEAGGFEWAVVDSRQIQPIFDKSLKKKLTGVMRCYPEMDADTGDAYNVYEYWNDTKCQAFRRRVAAADSTELPLLEYYNMFTDPMTGEAVSEYEHGRGEVPFIPFFNNNIDTDDLKNIKPLIDVYDKVFSGFINDLDDVQELIFILTGYGNESLNGFLQNIKKYKTIKLDDDVANADVKTLSIEIPIEARNSILDATRKAIFEQGKGLDPRPETFGNQSGEALKFMYALLEMKVGLMEPQFRVGFAKLIRAICRFYNMKCDKILQTWTRTGIKNDTEQANICKNSVGIVSNKTILKNHPLVDDVEAELEQLKEESEEKGAYGNAFVVKDTEQKKKDEEDGAEAE